METISFAADFLGPDLVPAEELADCARTVLERDGKTILSYGPAAGYTPLRALIGQWFSVHPSRVVLTNGSLRRALGCSRTSSPPRRTSSSSTRSTTASSRRCSRPAPRCSGRRWTARG